MLREIVGLSFVLLLLFAAYGQSSPDKLIREIQSNEELSVIYSDSAYRVQFVYTIFDSLGVPSTYDLSDDRYYYPASTVKLPIALATVERMTELGILLDDRLVFEDNIHCGNRNFVYQSQKRLLTFRQLLEEMLVVSDNDAYNALYHFVTPGYMNKRLHELGFSQSKIYRSFSGCEFEEHLHTNACRVIREDSVVYNQSEKILDLDSVRTLYSYDEGRLFGARHENRSGRIVVGPYDFNYHLEIPLSDLHGMMLRFFDFESYAPSTVWQINGDLRGFLENALRKFPSDLDSDNYKNKIKYPDNLYKYSIHGEGVNDSIKVYSKLGLSHGFTTETAYIRSENRRCILTISMYTNQNDTVNDGIYEYETVARPFINRLSYLILEQ